MVPIDEPFIFPSTVFGSHPSSLNLSENFECTSFLKTYVPLKVVMFRKQVQVNHSKITSEKGTFANGTCPLPWASFLQKIIHIVLSPVIVERKKSLLIMKQFKLQKN
jgi:hypothetical protein